MAACVGWSGLADLGLSDQPRARRETCGSCRDFAVFPSQADRAGCGCPVFAVNVSYVRAQVTG